MPIRSAGVFRISDADCCVQPLDNVPCSPLCRIGAGTVFTVSALNLNASRSRFPSSAGFSASSSVLRLCFGSDPAHLKFSSLCFSSSSSFLPSSPAHLNRPVSPQASRPLASRAPTARCAVRPHSRTRTPLAPASTARCGSKWERSSDARCDRFGSRGRVRPGKTMMSREAGLVGTARRPRWSMRTC